MTGRTAWCWCLLTCCFSGIASREDGCKQPWIQLDTGCYLFLGEEKSTWTEARDKCEQEGGYLAKVDSKEENDAIFGEIQSKFYSQNKKVEFWIGLFSDSFQYEWKWVSSGMPLGSYSNWAQGEPSPGEKCVLLGHGNNWTNRQCWTDNYTPFTYNALCEKEGKTTTITTPPTECCNTLTVKGSVNGFNLTGTYNKMRGEYKNKIAYQGDKIAYVVDNRNITFCIFYNGHWKLDACGFMEPGMWVSRGWAWSKLSPECPGDIWLNWRYYSFKRTRGDGSGPVNPTITIDCKSKSAVQNSRSFVSSAGYFPKTFTEKTEIATLISNITSEESSDSRGNFKCCKGPVSIGDCPTETIGIETIKVFLSVDNGQTTTNGDAVSNLCNTKSNLPSTTLLTVYEPTSQTTPEQIVIQCSLCNILLSSCCADETSVYKTNCRSYFRFYCYWLDCCACGFAQANSTCLYSLCRNTSGCYKA